MDTLWPLMIIAFFANLVESIAGFGSTILSLTFGSQFFEIEDLIPILVPLNVILSLGIVLKYYKDLDARLLLTRILPLCGIGFPIGLYLFQIVTGPKLKLAFGFIVVLLGAFELIRTFSTKESQKPLGFLQSAVFLIAGGIMQGPYASGGPFVVYYASRAIKNKSQFRTTISMLWLILNFILTTNLALTQKMNAYTLQFSLALLPFVLAGMIVGIYIHKKISEVVFKKFVYALLVCAGTSLIVRSL